MPTYEYKCSACGHKFEKFQSITSDPIKQCPACKKNKAQRLISAGAGLIFKGSGFYITDYRSESYKEKAKADTGGSESKGESKGESKSESSSSSDTSAAPKTETTAPTAKAEAAPKAGAKPPPNTESKPKKKS
ncbi:MAG TPA: zinc ribbon domain-containing protein [Tepidisphaeraceae bacterium]|nr:zinc ribbon domain-containing protein [Tepidisphaeraceae bacterium]